MREDYGRGEEEGRRLEEQGMREGRYLEQCAVQEEAGEYLRSEDEQYRSSEAEERQMELVQSRGDQLH